MDTKLDIPSKELQNDKVFQEGFVRGFNTVLFRNIVEVDIPLYRMLLDRGLSKNEAMSISWLSTGFLESEKEMEEYIKKDPGWDEKFRQGCKFAMQVFTEILYKGSRAQRMYFMLKESGKFTDEEIVEMIGIDEAEIPYAEELLKERLELLEKNKALREGK